MKLKTALPIVLLVAAAPAFAQKIYIEYDATYDRSRIKTFAWAETEETSLEQNNPLMHSRLVNAVEHYLGQGGLREARQDPDIYVTYHTNAEAELRLDIVSWGYGYPDDWYSGGYLGNTGTTIRAYNRGSLIIDIWDRRTKELIWRGSASAVVPQDPLKVELTVYKALKKMVRKWHKMRAQPAREP